VPRIELVVANRDHLDAYEAGPEALGRMLDADITDGWVLYPGWFRKALAKVDPPEGDEWGTHLFLLADPPALVGWGGFKGEPRDGVVEIGYEVAASVQGSGIATAAAGALIAKAEAPGAEAVVAHTLRERNASCRVLEKNGFRLADEVAVDGDRQAWLWRLELPG
jgi:RimJ/RimL family protein N-acetyltransferase